MKITASQNKLTLVARQNQKMAAERIETESPAKPDTSDRVTFSEETKPKTDLKGAALNALGAGMMVAAGATPGLGALMNFIGAYDTDRVPGEETTSNLHTIGMIANVVGTAGFLVNPVIGLAGLAVSGLTTAAALSRRS